LSKPVPKEFTQTRVMEYAPKPIERDITQAAEQFIENRRRNLTSFKLSDLVASQSGIAEKERTALEQKAENIALERIREIQEPAYQQAYDLGIEEGRKSAFEQTSKDITERLVQLDQVLTSLTKMKSDLLQQNEGQIIRAVYRLAMRIARFEIKGHDDSILGIMKMAVEHAQSQEGVNVKLSQVDYDFVQTIKDFTKRDMEFMKKIKMVPSTEVAQGGCVVETNYGTVNAALDERIQNMWNALETKIAKPKEKLESEES
jgi:flagellar assembly protein FliH